MQTEMLNGSELNLLAAIQTGFPLTSRPYQTIGEQIGLSEEQVIAALGDLSNRGVIKRLGIIVRHRELGYKANAMVVWNVPDSLVSTMGKRVGELEFVTLCYRRKRSKPQWPYNLYCMIHGRERSEVLKHIASLETCCGLEDIEKQILFSQRCFKQQGARYFKTESKTG
jgi:siroheme decarboxylase